MGKHQTTKIYEKYSNEGQSKLEKCPRCSSNVANHKDRKSCGKCGYSEIKKSQQ